MLNPSGTESYSELCISREKLIYQTLPKDPDILECLAATEKKAFSSRIIGWETFATIYESTTKKLVSNIQGQWIKNAIDAITLIHAHGVIHANISPRNFLVADDLSTGSVIGDLEPLVEEEDRYRIYPWSRRDFKTDLFAMGCLIYEISTGQRLYNEIDDSESEEIEGVMHRSSQALLVSNTEI